MSYENFPCGSPETESPEEPAPSLYVENTDAANPTSLLLKKPVDTAPSRLAETANIEDQMIMTEDEIAQVNADGDAVKINERLADETNEEQSRKSADDSLRQGLEGNVTRSHWIELNYGNPATSQRLCYPTDHQHIELSVGNNNRTVKTPDRASVIITRSKEQQEVESDSDADSLDTRKISVSDKEECLNLRCNENISGVEINDENCRSRSRALYYNYNNHEDVNRVAIREAGYESDNENDKGSTKVCQNSLRVCNPGVESVHGEAKTVPVYYMAGAYPHMLAMSGAVSGGTGVCSPQGNTNVLQTHTTRPAAHFARANPNEVKRFPMQHVDYMPGRPEQQVPVVTNAGTVGDGNVYRGVQQGSSAGTGLQYVDRHGFVQTAGFAVVPGIGPVRVMEGMYYQGIPMGGGTAPHHYDKFASVPSFVPLGNVPVETSAARHPQSPVTTSSNSHMEQTNHQGQDALLNVSKPYASPVHQSASPASSLEERRSTNSPALKSDSGSPAPAPVEDADGKKYVHTKVKGKQKAAAGTVKPEIKCDQCGKCFGSSSALAKHKLTHSDERRYVCSICGKGFKRQDHLNGHMVTHRDKKPYECSYTDCDKSYCDMRSLRRHLENHHTASGNGNGDSRTPGSGSPSATCSEKHGSCGVMVTANSELADSPRNALKQLKARPVKDKSDHLQVSGYDSGRSSGGSTPASTHETSAPRERPTDLALGSQALNSVRERNSDSFSSLTSDDGGGNSGEQNVPEKTPEVAKPHTAVDMLKQAAERVQGQQASRHPPDMWQERYQQYPYMVYHHDGVPHPQWYQTAVYAQDPRFVYQYHFPPSVYQMNPVTGLVQDAQGIRQGIMTDAGSQAELTKTVGVPTQAVSSPSQDFQSADAIQATYFREQSGRPVGTPTDPTAIAVATAKEMGHYRFTRESYYGVHPSGTQWQPVRYDEANTTYNSTLSIGNNKSLYGHPTVSNTNGGTCSDGEMERVERLSRGTQYRSGMPDEASDPPVKRPRISEGGISERREVNGPSNMPVLSSVKVEDNNNGQGKGDHAVFRNPGEIVTPRRKQRPRPEPLTIPPSVSTTYQAIRPGSPLSRSRPCSPPYTPPPMLSPRSIYHVSTTGNLTPRLAGSMQLPMTPSRLLLSSHSHRASIDVDDEAIPFPEPKINVGPQFQAEVPLFAAPKVGAQADEHKATLCWRPLDERKRSRREEIESFLDMACSVAVSGGGSNKEYALHILHRVNGNIKDAIRLLLSQKYATFRDDPMYDYHYEGSVRWASKERQIFRQGFRNKGKEFAELKKDIGDTKAITDCIEFYYHWKAAHPEAVRGRTRYIDSDSEEYEDTESETNSNPSLFECDFPQCNAKFVSRQALNGHIRVHGGSFMKPSEPRRKNRANTSTTTAGANSSHVPVKKRKSPSPAPALPDVNGLDGPLPEFACKVCGRIFHKIKSRSAHMKTHVKRQDDDEKLHSKIGSAKNH